MINVHKVILQSDSEIIGELDTSSGNGTITVNLEFTANNLNDLANLLTSVINIANQLEDFF